MPDATDFKKQLDTAIWTVLEANTQFTTLVDVGRRLKAYTDGEARKRIQRGANDYPQVKVEVGDDTLAVNAPKVFAQMDTAFAHTTCDTIVPSTQIARIIITYDKEDADDQTPLESAIRAALMSKYPTLGIAGASFSTSTKRDRDPANMMRTTITLTVNRRTKHSLLV